MLPMLASPVAMARFTRMAQKWQYSFSKDLKKDGKRLLFTMGSK
jgi:hypothetical protein